MGPSASSRRHEHEFRPSKRYSEEGRIIFEERCQWAPTTNIVYGEYETYTETGRQCEKCRKYHHDAVYLERLREGQPNIKYLPGEFDRLSHIMEGGLAEVEMHGELTTIDPDPNRGETIAETDKWRIVYRANAEPKWPWL